MRILISFALAFLIAPLPGLADLLLVPDSNTDQVFLFSAQTGALVNDSFLDIATQAGNAGVSSTPIEALEVGNEIWVTDQVADRIWRFARNGNYLGAVGAGELNNIRGLEVVGNTVYVAQGSAGTSFGEGVVTIDVPSLTITGVFGNDPADISYWDVLFYNGELLVTNSGLDGIERFDLNGNFLGYFAQSDGVTDFDFLQQLSVNGAGNLLAGGFSAPSGVYEFMSDGTNLGIVAGLDLGPRAGFQLGNGEIVWSNGTWFRTDDSIFGEGSFRFINRTSIPEPAAGGIWGLLAVTWWTRRKRRVS